MQCKIGLHSCYFCSLKSCFVAPGTDSLRLLLVTEISYFCDTWTFLGSNDAYDSRQYNASGQFGRTIYGSHRVDLCEAGVPEGVVLGLNLGRPWPCPEPAASDPYLISLRYSYITLRHLTGSRARCRFFENLVRIFLSRLFLSCYVLCATSYNSVGK